jgi:hypothetical protein
MTTDTNALELSELREMVNSLLAGTRAGAFAWEMTGSGCYEVKLDRGVVQLTSEGGAAYGNLVLLNHLGVPFPLLDSASEEQLPGLVELVKAVREQALTEPLHAIFQEVQRRAPNAAV